MLAFTLLEQDKEKRVDLPRNTLKNTLLVSHSILLRQGKGLVFIWIFLRISLHYGPPRHISLPWKWASSITPSGFW